MMMIMLVLLLLALTFVHTTASVEAVADDDSSDGSRKLELMLSMRDGIKLHTLIYLPREKLNNNSSSKYTAIVDRSPYGYGDMEWITDIFLPFGFVAIGQDIRYLNVYLSFSCYVNIYLCNQMCIYMYVYIYFISSDHI